MGTKPTKQEELPQKAQPQWSLTVVRIDGNGASVGGGIKDGLVKNSLQQLLGCKFYVAANFSAEESLITWYVGMSDAQDAATRVMQHIVTAEGNSRKGSFSRALESTSADWVVIGLNLINCSERELHDALKELLWGHTQSIVASVFLNRESHLSSVHIIPAPTDHFSALDFASSRKGIARQIALTFLEHASHMSRPMKEAMQVMLNALGDIETPLTFKRYANYALYLWKPREGSKNFTYSRRSLADKEPCTWTFKLEAHFVGSKQESWKVSAPDCVPAVFVAKSERALAHEVTKVFMERLCNRNCFETPAETTECESHEPFAETGKSNSTHSVAAPRRATRKIRFEFVGRVDESDKVTILSLKTLKALAIALGCTHARHGDYLERIAGTRDNPFIVCGLLPPSIQVALSSEKDKNGVVVGFVLCVTGPGSSTTKEAWKVKDEGSSEESFDDC